MIKSIVKAVDILSFVAMQPDGLPVTLTHIAEATEVNISTSARIVKTLCDCNYLEQKSRREGYVLGPMALYYFSGKYYRKRLIKCALPIMINICRASQKSIGLNTYANGKLYMLYTIRWREDEKIERVGIQPNILYGSASGRLFIANMGRNELSALIEKIGMPKSEWPEVQSLEDMRRECQTIKTNKYAVVYNRGPNSNQIVIGASIFEGSKMVAAISNYFFEECEFSMDNTGQIINRICAAANKISDRLEKERDTKQ